MADPSADRTEPATPKRLEDARKKGDVPFSRDASGVLVLVTAFLLALSPAGGHLAHDLATQARSLWGGTELQPETLADFHALWLHHLHQTALGALPLLLALTVVGVLGSLIQVGPLFASESFEFRWSNFDPATGLKRLVSPERLMELAKSVVKLVLILATAWAVLAPALGPVLGLFGAPPWEGLRVAGELARRLVLRLLLLLGVLALLDVAWVRWRHQQKLKMTKQEVRDEARQRDGDPQVRQRLRERQRLSHQRMIAEVSQADVVVRNPTHYAVALRYARSQMNAPTVVAKGRNRVAARILAIASEHEVPVVENPPLARVLFRSARVGREVPEALYEAVAEVLAYVYRLDRRRAVAWGARP